MGRQSHKLEIDAVGRISREAILTVVHDATLADGRDPCASHKILVVDADPALLGLLEEWLAAPDLSLMAERPETDGADERSDVVIVDVPFPRRDGADVLRRVAARNPGVPVLALSSSFFSGVDANGAVARALGVAGVLPKPLTRHALVTAVDRLLQRSG